MTCLQDRRNFDVVHALSKDTVNSLPIKLVGDDEKMRAIDSDLESFVLICMRWKLLKGNTGM
jgi:hypothetical protein